MAGGRDGRPGAGSITAVAQTLLAFPAERVPASNGVLVNAGATRVVSGERGPRIAAYNEHLFLPGPFVTYR